LNTKLRLIIVSVILVIAIFFIGIFLYLSGENGDLSKDGIVRITIPHGSSAWKTAYILRDNELVKDPRRFVYYLKARKISGSLKAGTYEFLASASTITIAEKLIHGDEVTVDITIPEGWMSSQIAGKFHHEGVCDSSKFMEYVKSTTTISEYGINDLKSLEGFLYPETYNFKLNLKADVVVNSLVDEFLSNVGIEWINDAKSHKFGLAGIVTLASIVQGEFQLVDEAPIVASLYTNRLNTGMKLQADPTVQYVIPDGPRRLSLRDLRIDNRYNTYKYKGLPPGPINNPGIAALKAALNPAKTNWVYMVARGDGGHTFTTNYNDHLKAKRRLDAIRRQVDNNR
jgi:peptidoglycan lytic transglycosylase G